MKSKRVKKIILIILGIVILATSLILAFLIKIHYREIKIVLSEKAVYEENWDFDALFIAKKDTDASKDKPFYGEKYICIELSPKVMFKGRDFGIDMENAAQIYNTYKKIFFEEKGKKYKKYVFTISFLMHNGEADFYIEYYEGKAYIRSYSWEVYIDELAKEFPETTYLRVDYLRYEDLNMISEFENLEHLITRYPISNEEREIILAYFPDCVIEDLQSLGKNKGK